MSDRTHAQVQAQQKTLSGSSPKSSLLQRTCACGQHTIAGGEYSTCRSQQSTLLRSQRAFRSSSSLATAQNTSTQENVSSLNSVVGSASHFSHVFIQIPVLSSHPPVLQTKLTVNQPGDFYEQEADQVAAQVMRMTDLEAPVSDGDDEAKNSLMCKQSSQTGARVATASPDIPSVVHAVLSSGGGQPLDTTTRAFMEPRFGHDFSKVRVHTDEQAAESALAVNALAYTVGRDVVFGARQYVHHTHAGRQLIAHELAHVVQQNITTNAPQLQRKMVLGSEKDAEAFKWFLTANDALNFSFAGTKGKPLDVTMKSPVSTKIDDAFRVNILKMIINHASESLLIQGFGLDQKVTSHQLYKDGKLDKTGMQPTLREMSRGYLGAGGVTIPSQSLALASDSQYTGPVTGVANQSWIFYSTPTSLAHEFGHAILLFSGTSWMHGGTVPKTAGVLDPEGKPYAGPVNEFISKFVAEKYAQLTLLDPDALHFSPTATRKWPEPPDFQLTFTGTWLQFLVKYPGATVSQKEETKGGKKMRSLQVCIPKKGEICPP